METHQGSTGTPPVRPRIGGIPAFPDEDERSGKGTEKEISGYGTGPIRKDEMDDKQIENLLRTHNVRMTANRILIARTLAALDYPVSMKELTAMILTIDKSSIFRTLLLFKDHHLVHQLEDGSDVARYELCLSHDPDEDEDVHVHFYCEQCQRTFCLSDTPVPKVSLPEGYEQTSVNYMVKGVCPDCSRRHYHKR